MVYGMSEGGKRRSARTSLGGATTPK